jgi:hypothetical protein
LPKKLGRNVPCWCGSGQKYKRCHLNREAEERLPLNAVMQAVNVASTLRQCLHPLAAADVCDRIVSAHTIQKSGALRQIVDSTNHVQTFFPITSAQLLANELSPRQVGWRNASTFTGFCARHDSLTFKPLETSAFESTREQCFLIGYRAVCHEFFTKSRLLKSNPTLRRLTDRGVPAEHQQRAQPAARRTDTCSPYKTVCPRHRRGPSRDIKSLDIPNKIGYICERFVRMNLQSSATTSAVPRKTVSTTAPRYSKSHTTLWALFFLRQSSHTP